MRKLVVRFCLAALGVPQTDDMSNHKAYVAIWLEALNKDSRFIFRARQCCQQSRRLYPVVSPDQPEPDPG